MIFITMRGLWFTDVYNRTHSLFFCCFFIIYICVCVCVCVGGWVGGWVGGGGDGGGGGGGGGGWYHCGPNIYAQVDWQSLFLYNFAIFRWTFGRCFWIGGGVHVGSTETCMHWIYGVECWQRQSGVEWLFALPASRSDIPSLWCGRQDFRRGPSAVYGGYPGVFELRRRIYCTSHDETCPMAWRAI